MIDTTTTAPVKMPGYWSGFRQGLGFMTAVVLVPTVGWCVLVLIAWLTYGSVRNMVTASVGDLTGFAGTATKAVVDDAKAGVARTKDRIVDGTTAAVTHAGDRALDAKDAALDRARSAGTMAGEKAAEAKESLRATAGGLANRFRWKKAPEAGEAPKSLAESPPTQDKPSSEAAPAAAPN